MKIAILADSIALPRGETWGDIPFESTYPYLLHRKLTDRFRERAPLILVSGKRMRTTREVLRDWFEEIELKHCELVVIQVGGGDCAPRFLMPHEKTRLENLPSEKLRLAARFLEKKIRSRFISLFPLRVCVSAEEYRENIRLMVTKAKMCRVRKLVFINIPSVTDDIERELPGSRDQANKYNAILREEACGGGVEIVDLHGMMESSGGPERLTVDGTHLNRRGLALLAEHLFQTLARDLSGDLAV